ncbi:hypothetical protein [Novosphingobium sp. Chol11]|uniref:hypothetical protein n=1 Tax=Novosphingobium sp. Chol11 TaxID=1385763 RepID=UPI0025DCD2DB|nr:hypothetical protein [Novosphingobium sp. Chol11]
MLARGKLIAAGAAAAALVLLAGCTLLPGRFVSDLAVRRDGTFTFHYKGEIILAALAQGGKSDLKVEDDKFTPAPCKNETTGDDRACTAAEIAAQRREWAGEQDESKATKAEQDKQSRAALQAMMGGINPEDPQSAQEFANRLARQQGWTSVVNKGAGVFEVDYSIAGRLDRDFTFPVIERLPAVIPFVTVIRRNDGTVRIDAPGFSPSGANPQMPGFPAMPPAGTSKGKKAPPALDGRFTVRTDGEVIANNTDEGPLADPAVGGQRLQWKVSPTTGAPPTALVRLAK